MLKNQSVGSSNSLFIAVGGCVGVTYIATLLLPHVALANIVMLFLLTVFLIAVFQGSQAGILAAFLSVGLFDYFCVSPRFSMAVDDVQYLITFGVMLVVALITGQLAARLKNQVLLSQQRLNRTQALYELASALSGVLKLNQVSRLVDQFFKDTLQLESVILLPEHDELIPLSKHQVWFESHMAWAAYQEDFSKLLSEPDGIYYFPLKGSTRNRGVLVLALAQGKNALKDDVLELLLTVASLLAITIERLHYVEVAGHTEMQMATERLRSSILSSLSHDLRTPLTIMVGMADSLISAKPTLSSYQLEVLGSLHQQSLKLSGMVTNLLEMARLQTGEITLRKEWQPLEEVIGASIQMLAQALHQHKIHVSLPDDLPMLAFDAVLMERVFYNLIENAIKYSPAHSAILITAEVSGDSVLVSVSDCGSGIPADQINAIFNLFVRAHSSDKAIAGTGIGLAVCRSIVEAHQGRIFAENTASGGACIKFTLPLGTPPVFSDSFLEGGSV
jgi:two-component system sensor histidine kinase KdpD